MLGTSQAFARTQVQRGLATLQQDLRPTRHAARTPGPARDVGAHPARSSAGSHRARPLADAAARPGSPPWRCWPWWSPWRSVARADPDPGGRDHLPVRARADRLALRVVRRRPGAGARRPGASAGRRCGPTSSTDASARAAPTRPRCCRAADHASYVSSATPFVGRPVDDDRRLRGLGQRRLDAVDGRAVVRLARWRSGSRTSAPWSPRRGPIGGQHVTVFSRESALRRQILGTAEVVDTDANGCPTHAVQQAVARPRPASRRRRCRSASTPRTPAASVLMWSGRVDAPSAQAYADAVQQAGAAGPRVHRDAPAAAGSRSGCTATTAPAGTWSTCTAARSSRPAARCR